MPKNDSPRLRKVNEAVKEVVAESLRGLKDPRLGFITVTDVRTTTDLGASEIFYTVLPDDDETRTTTAAGLRSATPMVRREVGGRLRLRRTPDLHFTHDPLPEHGRRIETLLQETHRDDHGDGPDTQKDRPQDVDS